MNKLDARDYVTDKQIELAKNSEYGGVVYTEVGIVAITKEGEVDWYGIKVRQYERWVR